jgi:hypothetical protein
MVLSITTYYDYRLYVTFLVLLLDVKLEVDRETAEDTSIWVIERQLSDMYSDSQFSITNSPERGPNLGALWSRITP